jgi:hypothetical protein
MIIKVKFLLLIFVGLPALQQAIFFYFKLI